MINQTHNHQTDMDTNRGRRQRIDQQGLRKLWLPSQVKVFQGFPKTADYACNTYLNLSQKWAKPIRVTGPKHIEQCRRICFELEGYVSCTKDMFRGLRIEGYVPTSFDSCIMFCGTSFVGWAMIHTNQLTYSTSFTIWNPLYTIKQLCKIKQSNMYIYTFISIKCAIK